MIEVCLVLWVSLGRSAVYAVVDLVAAATAPGPVRRHHAVLNASLAPGRPNLDLTLQLLGIGFGLIPVALAGHLLIRTGSRLGELWYDPRRLWPDTARGVALSAVVGGAGVAF